jgi:hypothetical protein
LFEKYILVSHLFFAIRRQVPLILESYILVQNFIFVIFSVLYSREKREESPDSNKERERFSLATIPTTKQVKINVNKFHYVRGVL